jgi:membrane-associated phospholipid phosphatase
MRARSGVAAHYLSDVVCASLIGLLAVCCVARWLLSEIRNELAEGVGFEPTRAFALPVFKTGAINRSTTPPGWACWYSDISARISKMMRKTDRQRNRFM